MGSHDSIESLRGLHQDLIAFSESHLRNVDRLWAELELRLDEFRKLLDQSSKSEASRKAVQSGELRACILGMHVVRRLMFLVRRENCYRGRGIRYQ